MNSKYNNLPAYVNVSAMAELLQLSRSRLYQLIDQGIILKPVYLISNKQPVYTKEMAMRNLQVKHNNVGINGQVVMFYSIRPKMKPAKTKKTTKQQTEKPVKLSNKHTDLIESLESLGMENITAEQIDSAIVKCFPDGTENVSEDEILREVFRYMKCLEL